MQSLGSSTLMRRCAVVANTVLDPSIVFSFDQTGFLRHRLLFDGHDLDVDLAGRVCLITGGNSGLGYATALGLAARGATVWLLCRNEGRAEAAVEKIRSTCNNPNVFHARVDVSDPDSIQTFVDSTSIAKVDVLVNNAGVLLNERSATAHGLELTLATNLVGPLRLTAMLLPLLRKGSRSRVIWVSSGGMYAKSLNVKALHNPPSPFDGVAAYAQTKRAMVVMNELLAEALAALGIASHCMHPGWANTPGVERSIPVFWKLTRPILRSAESGADTILWLAACDKAHEHSGLFWFDREARKTHLVSGTKSTKEERLLCWDELHRWANINPSVWQES